MFKVSKGIMPNYLSNLFMRTDQVHETRHAKFSYHLPKPNTNSINKLLVRFKTLLQLVNLRIV